MKLFVKASITLYIIAGALLFFSDFEFFPDFYQPRLMGALAFTSAFLIVLPRIFFKPRNEMQAHALARIQTVITLGLAINGAGGLGLYQLHIVGFEYDKLAHFLTTLLFTMGLVYFLRDWFGKSFTESAAISATIVITGGFGWELLEMFSDVVLGTQLVGGGGEGIGRDTTIDVLMNTAGIGVGLVILATKRRIAKGGIKNKI